VTEYLGIVTAQGVLGVNAFKDVSNADPPASTAEATDMVLAGLSYLAAAAPAYAISSAAGPSPTRTNSLPGSAMRWPR
jgi:hypothetical protein